MEIRTYQGTSVHVYMYGAFPRLQFVYNIMHFIYIRPLKRPECLGISDMIRLFTLARVENSFWQLSAAFISKMKVAKSCLKV